MLTVVVNDKKNKWNDVVETAITIWTLLLLVLYYSNRMFGSVNTLSHIIKLTILNCYNNKLIFIDPNKSAHYFSLSAYIWR